MAINEFSKPLDQKYDDTYVSQYVPMPFELMQGNLGNSQKRQDEAMDSLAAINASGDTLDWDAKSYRNKIDPMLDDLYSKIEANGGEAGSYLSEISNAKRQAAKIGDTDGKFYKENLDMVKANRAAADKSGGVQDQNYEKAWENWHQQEDEFGKIGSESGKRMPQIKMLGKDTQQKELVGLLNAMKADGTEFSRDSYTKDGMFKITKAGKSQSVDQTRMNDMAKSYRQNEEYKERVQRQYEIENGIGNRLEEGSPEWEAYEQGYWENKLQDAVDASVWENKAEKTSKTATPLKNQVDKDKEDDYEVAISIDRKIQPWSKNTGLVGTDEENNLKYNKTMKEWKDSENKSAHSIWAGIDGEINEARVKKAKEKLDINFGEGSATNNPYADLWILDSINSGDLNAEDLSMSKTEFERAKEIATQHASDQSNMNKFKSNIAGNLFDENQEGGATNNEDMKSLVSEGHDPNLSKNINESTYNKASSKLDEVYGKNKLSDSYGLFGTDGGKLLQEIESDDYYKSLTYEGKIDYLNSVSNEAKKDNVWNYVEEAIVNKVAKLKGYDGNAYNEINNGYTNRVNEISNKTNPVTINYNTDKKEYKVMKKGFENNQLPGALTYINALGEEKSFNEVVKDKIAEYYESNPEGNKPPTHEDIRKEMGKSVGEGTDGSYYVSSNSSEYYRIKNNGALATAVAPEDQINNRTNDYAWHEYKNEELMKDASHDLNNESPFLLPMGDGTNGNLGLYGEVNNGEFGLKVTSELVRELELGESSGPVKIEDDGSVRIVNTNQNKYADELGKELMMLRNLAANEKIEIRGETFTRKDVITLMKAKIKEML